jgi:hypothetical protein
MYVGPALAQFEPEGSHVYLYFPQFADGGKEGGWQTTFTFIHAGSSSNPAQVVLEFFDDNGRPLALDFGGGPVSSVSFSVPARGIRRVKSRMASTETVTGWARARASLPVQGTVAFRQFFSGRPVVEVTAHSTLPTHRYVSYANPQLGIAVANPTGGAWQTVALELHDTSGNLVGTRSISLPPLGHRAFNLGSLFAGLPTEFVGTVTLDHPTQVCFVAWTVNAEGGLMSTLPSGRYPWPPPHWERIWAVFLRILDAAERVLPETFTRPVALEISGAAQINAYAYSTGDRITVNLASSEIYGDAEAELAWMVAHEMGHIIQFRSGKQIFSSNSELDADSWGALLLLGAGYDPYAAAGALGRLQLAAGSPGLLGEFVRTLFDPHRSFSTRIDTVLDTLAQVCSASSENRAACSRYRSLFHPDFPTDLPLRLAPRPLAPEPR